MTGRSGIAIGLLLAVVLLGAGAGPAAAGSRQIVVLDLPAGNPAAVHFERVDPMLSIASATLSFRPDILPGTDRTEVLDLASSSGANAWSGGAMQWIPGFPPSTYTNSTLTTGDRELVSGPDGQALQISRSTSDPSPSASVVSSYLHAQLVLSNPTQSPLPPMDVEVTWHGAGVSTMSPSGTVPSGGAWLYLYQTSGNTWDLLGNYSTLQPDPDGDGVPDFQSLGGLRSYPNAGSSGIVIFDILVTAAPAYNLSSTSPEYSVLWADDLRVRVTLQGAGSWPTDIRLDVGQDGKVDWTGSPGLNQTENVDVATPLRAYLAARGMPGGLVTVPFAFTAATPGRLIVEPLAIVVGPPPPVWAGLPARVTIVEDQGPARVLDLRQYIDGSGGTTGIVFEVAGVGDPTNLTAEIAPGAATLVLTPRADWHGTTVVRMKATNGAGSSVISEDMEVTVTPVNDPPVLGTMPDLAATVGEVLSVEIPASDVDGDTLTVREDASFFDIATGSTGATFPVTGGMVGIHVVAVTVSDGAGGIATGSFRITVSPAPPPPPPPMPNRAPSITILLPFGAGRFEAHRAIEIQATVWDPDRDPLTVRWYLDGQVLGTGEKVLVPRERATPGAHLLLAQVSDGDLITGARTTLEFGAAPPAPVAGLTVATFGLAAGIAVLAGVAVTSGIDAGRWRLLLLLLPLYTRIRPEEVLDQYTRGRIHGFVVANPGAHYNLIRNQLELKNGTVAYHLRTLEREGYLLSQRDGLYRRFYPAGTQVPQAGPLTSRQERVVEFLVAHPGATTREVAAGMAASEQVASYHLRWMARSGLVRFQEDGRLHRYWPIIEEHPDGTRATGNGLATAARGPPGTGPLPP